MSSTTALTDDWTELVDRLAANDVRYLLGGSDDREQATQDIDSAGALAVELARAPQARLRDALVALLLRHPEYSDDVEFAARQLASEDPARRLALVTVVVAAALQREWGFSFDIYLPGRLRINAGDLAGEMKLPPPDGDFGRPCIAAAGELLRQDAAFPFNYEAGWRDVARRLLVQLVREARRSGP